MNFKVVKTEAQEMKDKAKRYTKGNVTSLIRLAVKKFNPRKRDLTKLH